MDNDIKKPVRFEAGKKLTKEEKKEVYKELKDSYRVNLRPHTVENDKIVWLFEASDYMTKSDITGRLLRWYIYLPDGRIAHPTEVFGASMPVSEVKRVQYNIEYYERQSDIKYNEVVKLLKIKNEIGKVVEAIKTALNNGAEFQKQFDSNDLGKKDAHTTLEFPNDIILSVPEYIIKNIGYTYLGFDKDKFIYFKVVGLRNKYVNGSLSDIDWERFYNEFKETENNDMERELEKGIAVEQEHKDTLEKVAAGDITPEQAIVETAQEHIAENPKYYDELEKIEKKDNMETVKIDNLISIMNSKIKNQGYSLKELYDEVIKFQGSKDGALIFSEFIKRKKDEGDSKIIEEFNRTSFVENINPIETPKIETMEQTKLGNDDWAKIPAQNKYATPVKSKAYQYSPYDKTFQNITDNFVGSDSLKPVFSGVFFNELGICTTDAHKLLYINHISEKYSGDYCVTPKCKKLVGENSTKDDKIDEKFPQYQNIIPNQSEFIYDIDLLALKTYCEIVIRSGFTNKTTNQIILTFDDKKLIGINGKFLIEAIDSFLMMGHRKVKVGIKSSSRAILFVADNNYDGTESPIGKSDFFLIMPVIISNMSNVFDFSVMQGDFDFDNLLNIAYSFEKDAVITKGGEVFHKINTSITKSDVKDAGELNLEQLQIAASFIKASKNSSLPILNTVKIENNTLNISNLEQAYSISDVKMPNGIYEIRGTALFPTKYDIDDFPKMPSDFKKVGQINRQELIKNFEHCLDFVGDDDLRPVMEGVHFYKDAMNLVIESTDAHAMYRNEIKNYNIDYEFNIIITKPKLVYKVLESFDCDEIDFYIQESGKNAYFECGTGKIYFFIESGRYPNTESVYPESFEKKLIFETKDFKKLESDIKRLAKKGGFKIDDVNAMFNFTESGIVNYTIAHNKGYGSETEYLELESGSISCKVIDDYSSLYSTFKTLIMPVTIKDKNFDLGFKTFNLNRLYSLGFDKVELGYTKPERAVVVLNESVLAGVKTVPNQKKKDVKKKGIIDVENETANIINEAFNEWDNIENESEHEKWAKKISKLRFGTYKNQNILDVIVKFEPNYPNLVIKKDFIKELYNALKIELPESSKPVIETKPEIVIEDSEEVKEWKEAIENLNYLLNEGGTDAENTEWREAIDNLNYLIEETPKMAKGGGVGEQKLTNIKKYLSQFPDNAKNWGEATEEIRDMSRVIANFSEDDNIKRLNFRELKTPSEWNIKGKKFILDTYNKLSENQKENFYDYFKHWFENEEFAKGGYLANENALMVANNNKQIFHHTKEMAEALKGAKNVPAWVVAKVNRSASDLSDATHYLEGAEGMYAEGGEMKGKHYDMEKEIMESQFGKSI